MARPGQVGPARVMAGVCDSRPPFQPRPGRAPHRRPSEHLCEDFDQKTAKVLSKGGCQLARLCYPSWPPQNVFPSCNKAPVLVGRGATPTCRFDPFADRDFSLVPESGLASK